MDTREQGLGSEISALTTDIDPSYEGMTPDSYKLIKFPKGKILLAEGKICKQVYFIHSGHLRAYYIRNGKELNVNFFFEGEYVTNLKSYYNGMPSEYNISASEPTIVRVYEKEEICNWAKRFPNAESQTRRLFQQLLIRQEEHSNLFKIYTPSERYHYIAKYYPSILQRVPLSQISSYLGISRETISRIRRNAALFVDF